MIDISLLIAQGEARAQALSRPHSSHHARRHDGPRADAEPTSHLRTYHLSDRGDMAALRLVRHEAGCILSPDEGLYVCVTHGRTLGWLAP